MAAWRCRSCGSSTRSCSSGRPRSPSRSCGSRCRDRRDPSPSRSCPGRLTAVVGAGELTVEVPVALAGTPVGSSVPALVTVSGPAGSARADGGRAGGRAGLDDVHGLALPLRPGLVEHAGRRTPTTGTATGPDWPTRPAFQQHGFALVKAHLETGAVAIRTTTSSWPSSTTSSPTGTPTRRSARSCGGCSPRAGRARRRHLQRAEHQPDRRRVDDPQPRLRHRLPARRPRRRPADRLAARRVRARPAVPRPHAPRPG